MNVNTENQIESPEFSGRSGNWELYQKHRPFYRPTKFIALVLLRIAAWSFGITCLYCVVKGLFLSQREARLLYITALYGLGGFLLLRGIGYFQERTLKCPLCHGTPLYDRKCRMHRTASKLPILGYASATVLQTAFTGRFRCNYCGTPFRLKK